MAKQQGTVYVIDDDESVRAGLAGLLRFANLNAETFPCADAFLNSRPQMQGACILLGIRVTGSTGFNLQKILTLSGLTAPVIVLSASDDALTRHYAQRLGAAAFFRKPVDDQALLDAIIWAIEGAENQAS